MEAFLWDESREGCRKLWMYGNVLLGSEEMSRGFFHRKKVFQIEKLHVQMHECLKEHSTVSALHAHLQAVNFQRCELVFVCNVQLHILVHVAGVRCHVCASSASGCVFVCFAVACWIECCSTVSLFQYLYFKPRMSRSKRKSRDDTARIAQMCQLLYCTAILLKVLHCKIKNVFFIFCLLFM